MASDHGKIKTKPAPKNDTLPKNKSTPDAAPSKAEGGEKRMDQRVRFRAAHRCAARSAHPSRPYPGNERRQLKAQSQQDPLTRASSETPVDNPTRA